ncbi:nucleotidyltransferase domain-containing protein [Candidatus Woesearchaeota archaeon]|nr:nucleotidyltransferase domain-containing protein [Candidatus Woesearchaeota archaeon]
MGLPTKEERVLELFLNEPTKHWHFSDITTTAHISEPSANKWLKKLLAETIIRRVKPRGKMPYFISNHETDAYRTRKKLYALHKLYDSGLLTKLQALAEAKAVIIFGSFARSDWHANSDVDIFILGNPEAFRHGMLWKGIGFQGAARTLEVYAYPALKHAKQVPSGLLKNVAKGYFVKGNIHDIAQVNA